MVDKSGKRVIKTYTVKVESTKRRRGPSGTGIKQDERGTATESQELNAELITSEHVDSKGVKIHGRHGG